MQRLYELYLLFTQGEVDSCHMKLSFFLAAEALRQLCLPVVVV